MMIRFILLYLAYSYKSCKSVFCNKHFKFEITNIEIPHNCCNKFIYEHNFSVSVSAVESVCTSNAFMIDDSSNAEYDPALYPHQILL